MTQPANGGPVTTEKTVATEVENVRGCAGFVSAMIGIVIIPGAALAATELLAQHFPDIGVYIYGAAIVVAIFLAIAVLFDDINNKPLGGAISGSWFLIFVVVGFGQLCKYWNMRYGGFITGDATYWNWALYGLSWIVDNVTANLGQIFGWNITHIQPIAWGARAITWAYNVCLDLVLVVLFLRYAPALIGRWRKH